MNETIKIIKRRRSNRSFTGKQIKKDDLRLILSAAMSAPFAGDALCHFTVIQDKKMLDELNSEAKEAAKTLGIEAIAAMASDEKFHCFYNAPTLIITSTKKESVSPEMDASAATENMLIAAESLGLGACWIYFVLFLFHTPKGEKYLEKLKIPKGYKPYTSAALGYKTAPLQSAANRRNNRVTYI
ncbi:MAG: nitroreductase family protein [Elusimicrobiota bacterium]|jgi:nitroreductase|nr:nitroreductase family protein [Elusimicrobiota bacterium]